MGVHGGRQICRGLRHWSYTISFILLISFLSSLIYPLLIFSISLSISYRISSILFPSPVLRVVKGARLVAVATANHDNAKNFGEKFGFERCYDSYDSLVADEDVHVVCVAAHCF